MEHCAKIGNVKYSKIMVCTAAKSDHVLHPLVVLDRVVVYLTNDFQGAQ